MPFFITAERLSLYYEQSDLDNSKPYCVLISGLTRDHTVWRKMVPLLAKNYRVVTFDNRDVGQSSFSTQPYEISNLADDLAELLQANHMFPAHIVGHSLGGFIALHLAARYPHLLKSLVLCCTIEKPNDSAKQYLQARIDTLTQHANVTLADPDVIRLAMSHIYAKQYLDDAQFVKEIVQYEMNNPYPQRLQGFLRQAHACMEHDATHVLAAIKAPTLVLTGEEDKLYPPEVARELASKIQGAQSAVILEAAHMPLIENPLDFYKTLKFFFDNVDMR